MRQYNAPALLAWGPELFGALEDRWGFVLLGRGRGKAGRNVNCVLVVEWGDVHLLATTA
jgi:hypothetical protein